MPGRSDKGGGKGRPQEEERKETGLCEHVRECGSGWCKCPASFERVDGWMVHGTDSGGRKRHGRSMRQSNMAMGVPKVSGSPFLRWPRPAAGAGATDSIWIESLIIIPRVKTGVPSDAPSAGRG